MSISTLLLIESLLLNFYFVCLLEMENIFIGIGVLTISITLLSLSAAWFFSSLMLYPRPKDFGDPEASDLYPPRHGLPCEDVSFTTPDGLRLCGWYIEKTKEAPCIILVHGRQATRLQTLPYALFLYKAGLNLLLIDMRNAGKSQAAFSSMGYYEQQDIIATVDFLVKEKQTTAIGILGFSMGAAASILAMAKEKRIQAGIFEGSYSSCYDIIKYRAKKDYHLPKYPLVPLVSWFFERRANLDISKICPVDMIDQIAPHPVFIIHGTGDKTVPHTHADLLYRAAQEPRQLWKPQDAAHVSAWDSYPEKTEERVVDFFLKYLVTPYSL